MVGDLRIGRLVGLDGRRNGLGGAERVRDADAEGVEAGGAGVRVGLVVDLARVGDAAREAEEPQRDDGGDGEGAAVQTCSAAA